MKYLISLFLLAPCAAQAQQGIQNVHEVATSTNTIIQTISICNSNGALDVANATSSGTLSGAFAIEVANPSVSTSTINCGFDVSVSSQIGSVWYGREITAGAALYWAVSAYRKLYCITQNSSGCTQATVTQFK